MNLQPAIFLDRDGVIIHNRMAYVRSLDQVKIYPQALKALAYLSRCPYKIVVVTNQAGIGKGLVERSVVDEIHRHILARVEQAGGRVDGIFICPHTSSDDCSCRKPKPGLLLEAAQALSIDLSRSVIIGDAMSDLQAGQRAGVCRSILVLTGRGSKQRSAAAQEQLEPFEVWPTLLQAVKRSTAVLGPSSLNFGLKQY